MQVNASDQKQPTVGGQDVLRNDRANRRLLYAYALIVLKCKPARYLVYMRGTLALDVT